MPESLDDTSPGKGDVLGPQISPGRENTLSGSRLQDPFNIGMLSESPNISEIDKQLERNDINKAIEDDILDEKIKRDLDTSKLKNMIKGASSPRDILKTLIACGEYSETVELFNHKWTIRALNQGDIITALSDMRNEQVSDTSQMTSLLISQIAYAIEACDGQSVYEWFVDIIKRQDYTSTEAYKMAVRRVLKRYLERMPASILAEFGEAYAKIEAKRNEALEELKKS
jgi:hypothetical protein